MGLQGVPNSPHYDWDVAMDGEAELWACRGFRQTQSCRTPETHIDYWSNLDPQVDTTSIPLAAAWGAMPASC